MQKQTDRIDLLVSQIVAHGDQDAVENNAKQEGIANCDAKEGRN